MKRPTIGPARKRGFTLVELMVGLAVGLFVSVIAVSLFVSTRKLQAVNSSSNRMAENARLAFDLLHKDLRLAGFRGCADQFDRAPVSVLNPGNGGFLVDASGVRASHGSAGAFVPALNGAVAAASPAPLADSDVLSIRVPVDPYSLALASSMANNTDSPNVGTATGGANLIAAGDIVLMSNCKSAVLFQVTGSGPPAPSPADTGVLLHDTAAAWLPGNVTIDLRAAYNRSDTAVYRMQTRHYFVAAGRRANTRSLWRLTVPGPAVAEEVVAGIDRLDLRFGADFGATPARAANRYVSAAEVIDWNNVLSARIQLLASTVDDGTARAASSVQFAGSSVAFTDRRLREVFSEVVSFRNQMP